MDTGVKLIATERKRQIQEEGYTAEHDSEHSNCALAAMAASYIIDTIVEYGPASYYGLGWQERFEGYAQELFPFDGEYRKLINNDPVRHLVKAGALIAAEIDAWLRSEPVWFKRHYCPHCQKTTKFMYCDNCSKYFCTEHAEWDEEWCDGHKLAGPYAICYHCC